MSRKTRNSSGRTRAGGSHERLVTFPPRPVGGCGIRSTVNETDIGGSPRGFQSTYWTTVLRAKDLASPDRRQALEHLIQAYWKPLYSYLRRRGYDVDKSKDMTQGFFTAFLERDFLQYVQRERGKFRTFLIRAMQHFLADEWDRMQAQKRGGGLDVLSLDFARAESQVEDRGSPERVFERQWALQVIEHALQAMRRQFEEGGRGEEFEVLKLHLSAGEAPSYTDLAKKLGITVTDVNNRLHRARQMYREMILAEIRSYTETEAEAEEEMRDLFSAFS